MKPKRPLYLIVAVVMLPFYLPMQNLERSYQRQFIYKSVLCTIFSSFNSTYFSWFLALHCAGTQKHAKSLQGNQVNHPSYLDSRGLFCHFLQFLQKSQIRRAIICKKRQNSGNSYILLNNINICSEASKFEVLKNAYRTIWTKILMSIARKTKGPWLFFITTL